MIKTVGVIGAGTMGNGIAQVFAQAGFAVRLVDVAQPMLDRARATIEKSLGEVRREGQADRGAIATRRSAGSSTATSLDALADADYVVEAIVENADAKRALFAQPRRASPRPDVDPRVEHVVDLDHRARRRDEAARQGARHALHEPGAADDAGRDDPRPGDVGRVDADRVGAVRDARQDAGRSGRLSRASSPTAS